jgi:1-deoxy-D-xylulose-5-phosphate reductoisomerase
MPFTGIVSTVSQVVEEHLESGWVSGEAVTLEDVLAADAWARERVVALLATD